MIMTSTLSKKIVIQKNGNDFSVKKCHANLQLEDGDRAKTTKIDRFKVVFGKNKRKSTKKKSHIQAPI